MVILCNSIDTCSKTQTSLDRVVGDGHTPHDYFLVLEGTYSSSVKAMKKSAGEISSVTLRYYFVTCSI